MFQAGDGEKGLELARQTKPDVILMDVMMPKVSGIEMLRLLQAEPDMRGIPVVVLTATQFDPSMEGVFKEEPNVHSFLKKPCGVEALRSRIEQALQGNGRDGAR